MPDDTLPPIENCPACGVDIDVSGLEPLTPILCPACENSFLAGRFLGDYELLDVMGQGGMGVVYRAMDRGLQRLVALKLLRREQTEEGVLARLEEEAAVTASINHPNVVKVFTAGTVNGRFYLAMELVDRGTLDDLIGVQGRVAERQALEIAIQMANGLRAANQHGLIHRDIKPGNILFSDSHTAKIVDFGLAIMEEASVGTGEIWGTPYYVSPERLEQKPEDFRGDIYSLGATIFHALAGRPPFEAEDATMVALKHLKSQAVSLQAFAPWVTGSTAFVINRTLMKDPAARYGSYDELIQHLEYARDEIASGKAQTAVRKRVVLETDEDRKRTGYLVTAMIVVALLLVGGAAWYVFSGPGAHQITGPPETASVGAEGANATQYEAARKLLVAGRAEEAAPLFHALAVQKGTPEPLLQWALLESGLASLAAGQAEASRTAFAELGAKPYQAPQTPGVGAFFARAAALGRTTEPPDPEAVRSVNPDAYGSLLFLIAGLKNWELGRFDEAVALLRDFQAADPHGNYAWIKEFRSLASDDVSDYTDYQGVIAVTRSAQTVPELQNAAASLRKTKADLRRSGPLASRLEEAAQAAEAKIKEAFAKVENENKSLAEAKEKTAALCRDWRLAEAQDYVDGLKFSTAALQREQHLLRRKVSWLAEFEKELGGGSLKGRDRKQALAQGIAAIPADLPAPQVAARKWHAGVYALFTGQKGESRSLLEAAGATPPWGDLLPFLFTGRHSSLVTGAPGGSGELVENLFTAPVPPLLPELTSTDLNLASGEKPGATSADEKTGVITILCGGSDIWGSADSFRFVHRPWAGDGQMTVRIESMDRTNDYTKGGLMIREGLAPNARMVYLCVTPSNGVLWSFRKQPGGDCTETKTGGLAPPVWLKLVKTGQNYSAFASPDGLTWQTVGGEQVDLQGPVEAGFAGTAHDPAQQTNVRMTVSAFEN